ncbi:MAG: ABC transporter ATP-binding protein [Planctomycetia bacterium]|nr:ABC transporter ATP-binding protein [Planctomycetia bacterium]
MNLTSDRRPVIVVDRLQKRFGAVEALKGVSLTVTQGEIFGLLGSNGAGKTTLIKTLIGALRATAGTVSVLELDPIRQAHALRPSIGYMPQAPALYEDLSPRENLRFFGIPHGPPDLEPRLDEVLSFIDLRSRETDPVYGFSGGMKQRVSLACALVHRPQVLLLDEPTAGVDPRLRETFWQHFRALASAGATLLVSTHQMDEVLHCDRVAVMRDGVILVCETPKNLLRLGRTTIHVTRAGRVESTMVENYADQLPVLLQQHNLDAAVTRIELEADSLETIVLRLVKMEDRHAR